MRIPRKKELLELQKKYRTDKKIGEVYGVPARLVAYWRQKKKIGPYSYPKYTDEKILELWERYGDDTRAGEELGISAAGFRQWRRKYKIDSKPIQLRLEQLELGLIDMNNRKNSRRETAVQKILAKASGLKKVEIGQTVSTEPDLTMSHENTVAVIEKFADTDKDMVWNANKIVVVLDKHIPAKSRESAEAQKTIREFVKKQKIRNFYDYGEGICHQIVIENGHILPGQLAFGTDKHTSSYGCLGAMATSVNTDEMGSIWATGRTVITVPETVKIVINGHLGKAVYARDIMLKLLRDLSFDTLNSRAIEFSGPTISSMSISARFTMTNVAMEMGAIAAIVPFDEITGRYIKKITKSRLTPVKPDPDAVYHGEIEVDVSYLTPQVGYSDNAKHVAPIEDATGKKIDIVVIGSCSSGRIDDLEIAARILRGRRIHRDLRMIIVPGSRKVLSEALDKGFIKTFVDSGCVVVNPGCDPCLLANPGNLASGERAITTTNRALNGDGAKSDSEIFTASPATAAATALEGIIADPRKYDK
ncbi:MAG: aconitase/3-isopropylmalate dehydratase large subunit family protein [candidate division Zixibacteria bacterium]